MSHKKVVDARRLGQEHARKGELNVGGLELGAVVEQHAFLELAVEGDAVF